MTRPFPAYQGRDPYVFVSYDHDDADDVYPQLQWLRSEGFNIWYDEGIEPGASWRDEVALALSQCKTFLYFVSPRSVGSDNCQQELSFALSRERRILAVHLEPTELTVGMEFSLGNKQAIMRADYAEDAYLSKLKGALQTLLPKDEPAPPGPATRTAPVDDKSIAILPFVNRSSDQENQYLCDGIAEELIGGLARLEDLRVASQLSTFALKNQNLDIETIGHRLNVRHVLSGSVQKSGNRVRVNVSLNDVQSRRAVWSDRHDGILDDVFELQETVARKVVEALQVKLGAAAHDTPLIDAGTAVPQAYNYFLLGMHAYRRYTQRSLREAIHCFERATELDPDFGRCYWFLFVAHRSTIEMYGAPPERESALAPERAAIERMRKTRFAAPEPDVVVQRWLDEVRTSEPELALEAIESIRHPSPASNNHPYLQLGMSLGVAGLLGGSADYLKYYLDSVRQDEGVNAHTLYAFTLEVLGRYDEAIDYLSEYFSANPDQPYPAGNRTMLYSRTGQYAKAAEGLADLARTFPRSFGHFYHLYWTGEVEAAREYYAWLDGQQRLNWLFKCWAAFLMGHVEKGLDHLDDFIRPGGTRSATLTGSWTVKVRAVSCLPQALVRQVWAHPRHRAMMEGFGATDAWTGELLDRVNELTPITGIAVRRDDDF